MRAKIALLSLLTITNLIALDIDEAVQKALESSHLINSKEYKIKSFKANTALLTSAYKPNLSLAYQYTNRDFENFMKKKKESLFNVSLDFNLFNGFYDKYSIKSQEDLTKSEQWLLQSSIADVKQQTKNSYLSLLQVLKVEEVQNEAVTLLQRQLKDSKSLLAQGLIPKSNYLKVKVELQNTKQEQLRAKSNVVDKKNILSSLLQLEVNLKELKESNITADLSTNFNQLLEQSLSNRSEIKYLEALKQSQKESIKAVNSIYYPKVGLSIDYNKYGDEFIPNNFSYGDLGSIDDEIVGTLNLSYDLYSGGRAKNQKMIYKYQILSIEEDIKKAKIDIKLQLQQALEQFKVTKGQIKVAKLTIEEAKEHYRMTNNRYKQQLDSATDLLDARFLLTSAKNSLTQAKYDHQKAIVNIERILGK
jgi:outer membrane protein TolC